MALKPDACIPGHKVPERISVHMISVHIRLRALERTFDLLPGSFLGLDKAVPHDLQALEECAFLLTIAWSGKDEPRDGKT